MYESVLEAIKSRVNRCVPVCCNQYKESHKKYIELRDQSQVAAEKVDAIRNDFGEEYIEDAEKAWKVISQKRDAVWKCLPITTSVDDLLKDIISEYSLDFIGNCCKGADGGDDTSHLWNRDDASCFKTRKKSNEAYILMRHNEYIYDTSAYIEIKIHYVFSSSIEARLIDCTINRGNVDWVLSDEPFRYSRLLKYDEYEKAEYKFMQSALKQKLEEFIEKHNLLESTANKGE